MKYFNSSINPIPINTWIWSSDNAKTWQLLKSCKKGCCMHDLFGTRRNPQYWYFASKEEGEKEQKIWDDHPYLEIDTLY